MDPHNELVNAGSICFAKPGTEYVVYRQDGGTFTLDLSGVTGTFEVEWLNPRDGNVIASGQVTGNSSQTFTAPDNNDWVLHLIPSFSALLREHDLPSELLISGRMKWTDLRLEEGRHGHSLRLLPRATAVCPAGG